MSKRDSEHFGGHYPANTNDSVEAAYREHGMEPPWLLEWEDGKVVGPKVPEDRPAPRHDA